MEIAYTYYKEGESAQAIQAADRFIRQYPNHPNVDYMYYLKGLASFNDELGFLGQFLGQDISERDAKAAREAFDAFKDLITRYPDSKYTPDARARMIYLANSQGQAEVNVARYYFTRKAYLAAIQRAQTVVRDFQQTPATEEALIDHRALVRGTADEGSAGRRRARAGAEFSAEQVSEQSQSRLLRPHFGRAWKANQCMQADDVEYAGFWIRVGAALIDSLLILAVIVSAARLRSTVGATSASRPG